MTSEVDGVRAFGAVCQVEVRESPSHLGVSEKKGYLVLGSYIRVPYCRKLPTWVLGDGHMPK